MATSSHGPQDGFTNVKDEELMIRDELEHNIVSASETHTKKLFKGNVASEPAITEFLATSKLYNSRQKRWRHIPPTVKEENSLYKPFHTIFSSILKHFYGSDERTVLDTHKIYVPHVEGSDGSESKVKSSPDVMFLGQGPNFDPSPLEEDKKRSNTSAKKISEKQASDTRKKLKLLYRHCASTADIKTDKNHRFMSNLVQVAVYSRQCFIQQQNRKFIYSLIITEKKAQLYQFDRSGVFHTVWINIHEDASDFVRLILGVSSLDCDLLGFDTNIFWKEGQRYIRTSDANSKMIEYPIIGRHPVFYRRIIKGRGTACWRVKGPDGTELLIKDAWRSKDRSPEWELLEKAKGLDGVGQMVAYEEGPSVSMLRGFGMNELAADHGLRDRTFCRIILQGYGKSIQYFESREQFLYALRDAIAGHRNLWNNNILHRDISINNILLGQKGAGIGNRGIVIDLDMAKLLDATTNLVGVDFRTGTRAFQSIMVLSSASEDALPHDHLDDLESFFYVLCWICLGYSSPGKCLEPRPSILNFWELDNAQIAASMKISFYRKKAEVTPYFGPIFQQLLSQLRSFFSQIIDTKLQRLSDAPVPKLVDLIPLAAAHYDTILAFFDKAIASLEGKNTLPYPVTPNRQSSRTFLSPVLASPCSESSLKRPIEDEDVDGGSPKPKKSRIRARDGHSATGDSLDVE